MDLATLGALLVGVGAVAGGCFTWLGKRGENAVNQSGMALTGYSTLTDNLQEERDRLEKKVAERDAEIARLCALVIRLGGDPS